MLDINALAQLKNLKQEIHDNTPRYEGRVRDTQGRYGFVNNEKGEHFFLSPNEMEKVLAGDTIAYRVETTPDGKQQAIIEKLIECPTQQFIGRYIVRGKGHFIAPDDTTVSRWMFVPPKHRLSATDGDFVVAKLFKHPYPAGKVQAEVIDIIGKDGQPGLERSVIERKFSLTNDIPNDVIDQAKQLSAAGIEDFAKDRTDLTHLPFVTIDSAGTRDIDDALYAEAQSDGWNLWIAIADPSALITSGSILDTFARQRATSTYFPDQVVPMLPAEISEQLCSLQEGQTRLAMVVELRIGEDGDIRHTSIHSAIIKSHAKLTYYQVSHLINGTHEEIPADLHGPVLHLWDCAKALNYYRQQKCLIIEDRPDYKLILDEQGHVDEIIKLERNDAHRLVEECMLACNRSVSNWLVEKGVGFFITNGGIRTERLGDVMALLKETLALESKPKLHELESYVHVMQQAAEYKGDTPLTTILARQQDRSSFKKTLAPHMGLGFPAYTTFTSPLRKYNDLLIHRLVKDSLTQTAEEHSNDQVTDDLLLELQARQNESRMAANQVEQWMKLKWLHSRISDDDVHTVTINHMGSNYITCRFEDSGIDGIIEYKNNKKSKEDNWVFDSKTMSIVKGDKTYCLNDQITVSVKEIDPAARTLKLTLVA